MIHHGCKVQQDQEEAWGGRQREVQACSGEGLSCLKSSLCRPCCRLVQECPSLRVSSRRARAHTHACSRRHTEARMPCSPPRLALCISFLKQKHPNRARRDKGSRARATREEARCVDATHQASPDAGIQGHMCTLATLRPDRSCQHLHVSTPASALCALEGGERQRHSRRC